jgi:hypothetical protein
VCRTGERVRNETQIGRSNKMNAKSGALAFPAFLLTKNGVLHAVLDPTCFS